MKPQTSSPEFNGRGYKNDAYKEANGDNTPMLVWASGAYTESEILNGTALNPRGILVDAFKRLSSSVPKNLPGNQERLFQITLLDEEEFPYWRDSALLGFINEDGVIADRASIPMELFERAKQVVDIALDRGYELELITHVTPLSKPTPTADEVKDKLTERFKTAGEMFEAPEGKGAWIVTGGARKNLLLVQAATNQGKTLTLLQLAIHLAIGRPWEPLTSNTTPLKVVFADYESTQGDVEEIVSKQMNGLKLSAEDRARVHSNLSIYCIASDDNDDPLLLDEPHGVPGLAAYAKDFGADVVIIDPIADAFPTVEENSNSDVKQRIITPVRSAARCTNSLWIISHHKGKLSDSSGDHTMSARGASALPGAARSVIDITVRTRKGGQKITVFDFAKVKGRKPETREATLDFGTCLFTFSSLEDQAQAQLTETHHKVWARIEPLVKAVPWDEVGATFTDIMMAVNAGKQYERNSPDRKRFSRALAEAVSWGALVKPEKGRYVSSVQGVPFPELPLGTSETYSITRLSSEEIEIESED